MEAARARIRPCIQSALRRNPQLAEVRMHLTISDDNELESLAVEPTDDNLVVLRENVGRNGLANVTIAAVAAGRQREDRSFYVRGDISAVNSFYQESVYAAVTEVVPVTVAPLDDLVDGDADLVKIDVEGAELAVLKGAVRTLRDFHPVVLFECASNAAPFYGHNLADIVAWLCGLGFATVTVNGQQVHWKNYLTNMNEDG